MQIHRIQGTLMTGLFKKTGNYLYLQLFFMLSCGLVLITASTVLSQENLIYYTIPYTESSPDIDGIVSEGEWYGAELVNLNNETSPSQNVPALVDTEVLMMEDGLNFYVAFIAFDPEPDKIRAFFSDRDGCWDDDLVTVVIDTFNDERRAFEFSANPLGVQMDAICDDVSGGGGFFSDNDSSWNAIWDSAGKISDTGYVVEMKIPLSQLRFPGGLEKQTWGIDLLRSYPRDQRHKFSNNTKNYDLSCYLCQLTKAQGFTQLEQSRNLRIVPTVTASYSKTRPDPKKDDWREDTDLDVGLDIRWGINQDFYLNATINPDFSQVEADVAELDVNNTFSIFYPERREFFLDGADYFNTFSNLVHTRNISSPKFGIKLTGKRDVHTFGLFFADDETTSFLIPGNQGSLYASLDDEESLNTAFRYRLDVNRNINLGMLLTDRRADDYSNTVVSVDGSIRLGSSDTIEMQVMRSASEYPADTQMFFGQEAEIDDFAYKINYGHRDNNWEWSARYTEYGDDFRADMGFITHSDYRNIDLSGGHNWHFGPGSRFSRFFLGADYKKNWDIAGNKLEEKAGIKINLQGPMQSFMFMGYNHGEKFYNGQFFDVYNVFFFGHIRPLASVDIGFDISTGDGIDYFNTRSGREFTISPQIELRVGKHFKLDLRHNYQTMDIDGERLYTTNLTDLRFTYQFTIRSFIRVTVQYSDTDRDLSLYVVDTTFIDSRSRDITSQVLYSYKINPQTKFFIGYSESGLQNDALNEINITHHTVFTKLSYAF